MTTTTKPPILCAGTPGQPACKHFQAETFRNPAQCVHPENMRTDYVHGGLRVYAAIMYRRDVNEPCGPLAHQYEPRPEPF